MTAMRICSPRPGDGKTTVAANFAVTLALRGMRVLLIDADLRRGRVADLFGVPTTPGLAEVLTDPSTLSEAVRPVAVGADATLYCIPTGAAPAMPSQLLSSDTMRSLIQTQEQSFDRIVIDSPPLNLVLDAAVLGAYGLDVVVVARAGVTPLVALTYAAEQFQHAGTSVVGAVVNDIDFGRDGSYDPAYQSYRYARSYYAPSARA
jgi:tyrosine-protein kinase Etk/Wzc